MTWVARVAQTVELDIARRCMHMTWRIEGINDEFDQFKLVQLVCIHPLTVVKNRIHSLHTHHCVSDISGIIIVVAICTAHCQ